MESYESQALVHRYFDEKVVIGASIRSRDNAPALAVTSLYGSNGSLL
jgi:hypothetical protein